MRSDPIYRCDDLSFVGEYELFGGIGGFKKNSTIVKAYTNLFKDMYNVLNCHNVAKHAEFHKG
jgi:hypothetical protein